MLTNRAVDCKYVFVNVEININRLINDVERSLFVLLLTNLVTNVNEWNLVAKCYHLI